MQKHSLAIEAVKTLFDGWNAFHRVKIKITSPDGVDVVATHSVEAHGEGVAIMPYDPDRRVALLVRQLRTPIAFAYGDGLTLEVPAGGRGTDSPDDAAKREMAEEVGVQNAVLERIGAGYPMPGVSTELTHLYLAKFSASQRVGGGGVHADGEFIEIVEMPLSELEIAIQDGRVKDLKAITLLYALKNRHPELFRTV
jgi:nudix-type nucleoside diphosphatase (YffH/AdpP family)